MLRACAILLIPFPLMLSAQDPGSDPAVLAGQKLFAQTCGFCHGRDARGASGPDLIRSTLVNHDVNGNLIGEVVRNGRPAKGMPAFQLSDEQIRSIAAFLHAEASGAASVARRIPTEYPLSKLLVGDASRGAEFFKTRCSGCHSTTGDLAHIASKYKPFDLQTRIAFPSGAKNRVEVTDGNTIRGVEVYSDEFYVTLRDAGGVNHTYPRSKNIKITDPLVEHERLLKTYTDQNLHDVFAYLETLK